ncbi:hypothetical protein L1987_87827 [Smallanthus sonchifolius]|nr:hypothetical protein L1987_87827 [Smallanthus sonchifolius]
MFEACIKCKFHKKSKRNIKRMLMRIEMIKRKRGWMVKHLRSDIAELLRIGHDSEAYGRVIVYLDQNQAESKSD